jgi:hypothetical protein
MVKILIRGSDSRKFEASLIVAQPFVALPVDRAGNVSVTPGHLPAA